jgi:hypothetical protein
MRSRTVRFVVLAAALGAAGCASSEQWQDWRSHNTHFASDQHMGFSVRNTEGSAPKVRRTDIDASRTQQWWGKVVTVSEGQIFQN